MGELSVDRRRPQVCLWFRGAGDLDSSCHGGGLTGLEFDWAEHPEGASRTGQLWMLGPRPVRPPASRGTGDMAPGPTPGFLAWTGFTHHASEVPQGSPALACQKSRMAWVASKWDATGGLPTVVGPGQLWPPLMTVA